MKKLKIFGVVFFSTLMLGQSTHQKDPAITAVSGESWLHHLGLSFDETSMGKTWQLGPASDQFASGLQRPVTVLPDSTGSMAKTEAVHGSDLYRLNCQGCHGEDGRGAPPEIGSLIDPVRATSFVLVTRRMKTTGITMSRRETAELVDQSRVALLKRLHEGGKYMPSFQHLSRTEILSLVAYLNQLAGVPGAEAEQVAVRESHARVGELIVKSTCHVCHDATGPNPTPERLLEGAIPPLSALPVRMTQTQLVRKVTSGAPVADGGTSSAYRSRMPVFTYLRPNEAADVYEYLTHVPPAVWAETNPIAQTAQTDLTNQPSNFDSAQVAARETAQPPVSATSERAESTFLPASIGLFTALLLALSGWITIRVFKRLSVDAQARTVSRREMPEPQMTGRPTVEVITHSPDLMVESLEQEPYDALDERRIS